MNRLSLQLVLGGSMIVLIMLSAFVVGNPEAVSATSDDAPVGATPTPTSTPTHTPTSTATSTSTPTPFYCCRYGGNKCGVPDPATTPKCDVGGTPVANAICGGGACATLTPTSTSTPQPTQTPTPTGLGYYSSHVSFEAGVVSNNPFKISQTPAVGATPAQFALGNSGTTDVKGFVTFRVRDKKAVDCAAVPNSEADPSCGDVLRPRIPDFDVRIGATFAGSSSSTSASTIAGTGDVSGEANVSWPLLMWQTTTPSSTPSTAAPLFVSLGPGFIFDGNTDRDFQDTHTTYTLGLAINAGAPVGPLTTTRPLELGIRWGFADVEIPTLVAGTQNPVLVASNSIGEPSFHHVWANALAADVQMPLTENGTYLTLGGSFYGNAPFAHELPIKPWTFRLGAAVPLGNVGDFIKQASTALNFLNPVASPSTNQSAPAKAQ